MKELHHWRGAGADIQFGPEDFEVMELAMGVVPEVRLCALVLKWVRDANLQYPVQAVDDIVQAFPHKQFAAGGHVIDPDSIRVFMAKEYFPIEHEYVCVICANWETKYDYRSMDFLPLQRLHANLVFPDR